ncbi:GGDEF domain-containing protein [Aestuariibacter salexigens]|uniref:tetratricopeptide repeat-containing diguanylate cyclase n=1 Tax=Aestuariibacter salexigens TaxID=226010 RepID=UPI000413A1CF|nr:GGDEF domain-containing protein [Aestuariibacter salexigens]
MFNLLFRRTLLCFLLVAGTCANSQQSIPDTLQEVITEIESARQHGDVEKVDELIKQLNASAMQNDSPLWKAMEQYQRARHAMERNKYDDALVLLEDAALRFQQAGQDSYLIKAYRQLGLTYRYKSDYANALEYLYLALQKADMQNAIEDLSSIHNSIGVVLEKMGQLEEAVVSHQLALELNLQTKDQSGIATALYNLGDIRRQLGDFDQAESYFLETLQMDEQQGDLKNIAYSSLKLAQVYLDVTSLQKAEPLIRRAISIFIQIDAPRDEDWARSDLAMLMMKRGELENAQLTIEEVIQRALQGGYQSLLIDAYEIAANIAIQQTRYEDALVIIEKGFSLAQELDETTGQRHFQALAVEVNVAQNRIQEAFDALVLQKNLDDEVLNRERLNAIASAQAQTEFMRRENQIAQLEKQQALQQAQLESQRMTRNFWLTLIGSLSLLTIMMYGRYVQWRANLRLEAEVEARTEELQDKNKKLAEAYEEVEALSLTDRLTGLKNRRFVDSNVFRDLDQIQRKYSDWYAGHKPQPRHADLAVFIVDMDDFKQVNDAHGHAAGDQVLIEFARRIKEVFRASDFVARWGGEEFVAIARAIDRYEAESLAARLLNTVSGQPFVLRNGSELYLSCSIGFACYPLWRSQNSGAQDDFNEHWQILLSLADACLYEAKTNGKARFFGITEVRDDTQMQADLSHRQVIKLAKQGKLEIRSDLKLA